MPRNYNKTSKEYGQMIGNKLFIVLFYILIVLAFFGNDLYKQKIASTHLCSVIAQDIKNDVSYANVSGIQNYFAQKTFIQKTQENINFPKINRWRVSSQKEIVTGSPRQPLFFLTRLIETTRTCTLESIKESTENKKNHTLTITTLFSVKKFQLFWVLGVGLLLSSLPAIVYSRIRNERLAEKETLLDFFTEIAERSQTELKTQPDENISLTNIIETETQNVLNFIDKTYEVNDNYDPEYVTRLERNFIDLEERNAYLAIKNKKLNNQTTLKSSFFANLSHDFRTPLYTIDGYSRLLLSTPLERKQLSHVNSIQIANANLLELVSNFLSLSRLEAGKIDLDLSSVDLNHMIKEITTGLSFLTIEHHNHFFIDLDKNLPKFVEVDAIKLRQILANLISNAVKYTHDGILYIRVSCREADNQNLAISISITDTGRGISEADLQTIFDPYTRLDRDKTKVHGTGLGLGICKELCEVIGAKLSVASQVNSGSNFIIDLYTKNFDKKPNLTPITNFKENLYIFNSISALDIYINEWLKIVSTKPTIKKWDILLHKPEEIVIEKGEKILILLNYATTSSIRTWSKYLKKYSSDVVVYAPIDFLSSEEMTLLEPFIVLDNNASNLELAHSLMTGQKSPQQNFAQKNRQPLLGYVLLLAEDNDLNRKIIEERLASFGANVISCPDGSAALELYKAREYSAILMDAHMPKISGIELTKIIRRDHSDTLTPIIGITASTSSVEYQYFIEAGMTDCLIKPLEDRELIKTIKKYALSKTFEQAYEKHETSNKTGRELSTEKNIQERIDELSIKSIQTHLEKLEKILALTEMHKRHTELFNEIHKLNGTLSMTSYKDLQQKVNEIEQHINPVLLSSREHTQEIIAEKLTHATELLKNIWPNLEERAGSNPK